MHRKKKIMSQEQPLYSEAYSQTLALATRYASGADDNVLRLKHLLAAFLDTDGNVFREILGVKHLIRPENLSFEPKKPETRTSTSRGGDADQASRSRA